MTALIVGAAGVLLVLLGAWRLERAVRADMDRTARSEWTVGCRRCGETARVPAVTAEAADLAAVAWWQTHHCTGEGG